MHAVNSLDGECLEISSETLRHKIPDVDEHDVFRCKPPGFTQPVYDVLRGKGVLTRRFSPDVRDVSDDLTGLRAFMPCVLTDTPSLTGLTRLRQLALHARLTRPIGARSSGAMKKSHPKRRVLLASVATLSGIMLLLSFKPSPNSAADQAAGNGQSSASSPLLAAAMTHVRVEAGAKVSVAVLDVESRESAAYGTEQFDTASIVKVDILATLLLQAQDAGRQLTAQERSYATAMIENSDNASATALWQAIGRKAGLDAANERFGMTRTEGGAGQLWGLTQTTALDQLALLQQVFGGRSNLSKASQAYLQELMGAVAEDQDWGVSAAGSAFALKNGWLPRTTTGLWDINSIGWVTSHGRDYLVAVLSNGNTTKAWGIWLVEAAAKAAVRSSATGRTQP
jgi:beta-lactamase class A